MIVDRNIKLKSHTKDYINKVEIMNCQIILKSSLKKNFSKLSEI